MSIVGFPNPVNEVAARTVAGGVVVLSVVTLALGAAVGHAWLWLTVPIAVGFVARVIAGPRFSPLGLLATRVVAPRIGHEKLVAGPPKRFAQLIGATVTVAAVIVLALGLPVVTMVLLGVMIVAATLESVFALCLGCRAFAVLMRVGVIPEETCAACADISLRHAGAVTG